MEDPVVLNVDYRGFNNDDLDVITEQGQFTLRNTDPSAAVTARVSVTGLPSGYVALPVNDVTIAANSTATVTFSVNVTHDKDAGREPIGSVVITDSNSVELDRASLVQDTETLIELRRVEVNYIDDEGEAQSDTFDSDDTTFELENEVKPGTEISLSLQVKNLMDNDYDQSTFEDIQLTIDASNDDILPDNYDDEYSLDELDGGQSETFDLNFTLNTDAEARDYTFDLTLEAEDGEGAVHTLERELKIKLKREANDVRIIKAEVSPAAITACDASFSMQVELKNLGSRVQDETALVIYNERLNINKNIQNIELDDYSESDSEWSQTVTFNLNNQIAAGTYPLDVKAYIRGDEQIDSKLVNVVIGRCATPPAAAPPASSLPPAQNTSSSTTGGQTATTTTVTTAPPTASAQPEVQGQSTLQPTTGSSQVVSTVESMYSQEDFIVGAFLVAMILVLALIVIFFIILLK